MTTVELTEDMDIWRVVAEWDWVFVGTGSKLHAVKEAPEVWDGVGTTLCGNKDSLRIPGLFERGVTPRCMTCCTITGMPYGNASPKNIEMCRPIAQARVDTFIGSISERAATDQAATEVPSTDPQGEQLE